MLKKLDHPTVRVVVCSCFFAGFGFAVGEAVQRVYNAVTLNAVHQHKNLFEWAGEYFDARVTLFTLVFVIVAAVEAGFFFYQLRLKRQITRATVNADATAREAANETRALLARLNEYDLERELWISISDEMNNAA
jgi:hypothetical protein